MFDYSSMFDLTGKTALLVGAGSGIVPLTAQIKESPDWYDSYAGKSILGRSGPSPTRWWVWSSTSPRTRAPT